MVALLWRTKTAIPLPTTVNYEFKQIHEILTDITNSWSINIGHVGPRDAQYTSLGDAWGVGGGAFCHELEYWFHVVWSQETQQQFVAGKIHIFEFIVVILQLAAAIVKYEEQPAKTTMKPLSKLLIRTDNSPSRNWAHKVSAKSERCQLFLSLYAHLIERTPLTIACDHIAGVDNNLADFISRPPLTSHSHADRCEQIFLQEPKLKFYNYFRPSAELLSCLEFRLFTEQWQVNLPLPKSLGQFETVNCITCSCSVIIWTYETTGHVGTKLKKESTSNSLCMPLSWQHVQLCTADPSRQAQLVTTCTILQVF